MMNRKAARQAQQLQNRLAKALEELEAMTVQGSAGGGIVRVTITSKQEVTAVAIEPEAAEDLELLRDLVIAAFNDALNRTQELATQKMGALTGGLNIPGLILGTDRRPARPPAAPPDSPLGCWPDLLRELSRETINKYSLGALLRDCRLDNIHFSDDDATLVLPFSNAANYDRMQEELNDPRVHAKIRETIAKHFQRPLAFTVTLAGANGSAGPSSPNAPHAPARSPVQDSPLLRTAIGLGARIIEDN